MLNIYVGNLPYSVADEDLNTSFSEFGEVTSAHVISDRDTGRSKGFGFVEMSNTDEGQRAIEALDGSEMQGRNVRVNEAKPREDRPRRRSNY
ncbi:MAG: RNA-binding protein [Mariprofundales bacterium]|nr:RNA-binding protein [Mariprofundales bacterium]